LDREDCRAIDRQSISVAEFNDLLSFTADHGNPTTHALIIRDCNELLIYAQRKKNADSDWEIRDFRVLGHDVQFRATDQDRADLAAILVEEFDGDDLTTDERYVNRRPIRHGVPAVVAIDGKPAVAAWLYVQGETREEISQRMAIGESTVVEYLSRFRRRGTGIPAALDVPNVGEIVETVPSTFDPSNHQMHSAEGGVASDGA
jgi:hypothetical protein